MWVRPSLNTSTLIAALVLQVVVAFGLRDIRPVLEITPTPPDRRGLELAAFGDRQFLYRKLAMDLQNFGDTGGRVTPLKDYDMPRVIGWLWALDSLDFAAQHHVVLAARYFGQTQDISQLKPIIRYIQGRVQRAPENNLHWMTEAIYLAVRLDDRQLLLELADQLGEYDFPAMSVIAYQLPAILYEKQGGYEQAVAYMERALRLTQHEAAAEDKAFMHEFLAEVRGRVKVE